MWFGEKMFTTESNSIEIYYLIKVMFLELGEV